MWSQIVQECPQRITWHLAASPNKFVFSFSRPAGDRQPGDARCRPGLNPERVTLGKWHCVHPLASFFKNNNYYFAWPSLGFYLCTCQWRMETAPWCQQGCHRLPWANLRGNCAPSICWEPDSKLLFILISLCSRCQRREGLRLPPLL